MNTSLPFRRSRDILHSSCSCSKGKQFLPAASPPLTPVSQAAFPKLKILFQDASYVAIDKPRGMHVHPPEDKRPIPPHENTMMLLKKQLGGKFYIYPLHRIDRATSGVVMYGLSAEAASDFGTAMRARSVRKVYYAFVRGFTDTTGVVDDAMGGQEAVTLYETVARVKLPMQVGRNKFPTQRYSLVRAVPLTGRYHQIRRHFNYIAHPIVGDGDHGDRYHNRKFADELGLPGMFLRAAAMFFRTQSGHTVAVTSPAGDWEPRWHAVFDAMGMCPLVSAEAALPLLSGAQAASGSSFGSIEHEPLARSPTSATSQEQGPGVLQAKDHEPQLCQGAGSSQHAGLGADEGSALRLQADQWSAGLASGGAWSPGFCEPLPLLGSLPSLHMVARVSQEHVTPSSLQ